MFNEFKEAVAQQFETMRGHPLYRTDVEKDLMWLTYLESFPEGANPMFRERTEHDCQSCKSFIRAAGSTVAVVDGELVSLWDCSPPAPYDVVAAALSELVKSEPIKNVMLHESRAVGVDKSYQETDEGVLTWEHFHVVLPEACVSRDRGTVYGEKRSSMEVLRRALEEITHDAIDTVVELIDQDSLYRGAEHRHTVESFRSLKLEYDNLVGRPRETLAWRQDIHPSVSHIRNSAIGTLLVDLSEGKTLDAAVRMFESKVAPQNYRRPKAVVTKAMVERARQTVAEMGYTSALGRRFAVASDITVNNVLFANRDARRAMAGDVFDEMIAEAPTSTKSLEKVEEVSAKDFFETIVPQVSSIELLLENRHAGNFVNLVAPADPKAKLLFKWGNNFSWAYAGDMADSIKERVKARGGDVSGDFRASLAWFNSDDLDLHLIEPSGEEICHSHRRSRAGGVLDVDMNVRASGAHFSRNAVENITYPKRSRMPEGKYRLSVHNFTHREWVDVGFEVEVEFDGVVHTFAYDREVRGDAKVLVAEFTLTRDGLKFGKTLPRQESSKVIWGLPTQKFHPVTMAMFSPNCWGRFPMGNQHYMFMLQDCRREGSSRGFFNEQLSDDLREHRKVFEILGGKMRTEDAGEQLSGLGFSSTQRNSVYAKVTGAFTRTINIKF